MLEYFLTFGMAMVPVVELRGALPFGLAQGLAPMEAYLVSVLGNLVPVPFIVLLIRYIFERLSRIPFMKKRIDSLVAKAHLKGRIMQKYRLFGLFLLVAIPLPGTGAWTGALVAALLEIRLKLALPVILAGILVAGGIMLAASCGVIALWV